LLAIESSCDETAVACLVGMGTLRSSRIASQERLHQPHGGVVPEVASRSHLEVLPALIREAVEEAGWSWRGIDALAATQGPGLAPALLVGLSCAKGLALGLGRPFFAVNHIEAHLLSPFFGQKEIPPHVGLIVSGGHTLLVRVERVGGYEVLGRTRDDAAGEAFDKVGKMLGLGYPGGIEVDRLAAQGNSAALSLPRGLEGTDELDFSFSGLKTAVRYLLEKSGPLDDGARADLCAAFRQSVVNSLVSKTLRAMERTGLQLVGLSGGVSANKFLQAELGRAVRERGGELLVAPAGLHTDNAAMIAYVAAQRQALDAPSDWDVEIAPRLDW
jgi:N6-L-threonylcarbamoyladenine synthase